MGPDKRIEPTVEAALAYLLAVMDGSAGLELTTIELLHADAALHNHANVLGLRLGANFADME